MSGTPSNTFHASSRLGDLFASLPLNQPRQWDEIENTAQSLANDLRIRDVDRQTALGKTLLPQTLTSLLKGATDGAPVPKPPQKAAIYELLRVGANLCMDHDENRAYLLEAGFPQTVVTLLEGYADSVKPDETAPLAISVADLRIVKTAIGVLLNASFGYEPVKTRLITLEAALTVLKLSLAIYPPGSWLQTEASALKASDEDTEVSVEDNWTTRAGLSQWAWRLVSELGEGDEEETHHLLAPEILPYLVRGIKTSIPPYPAIPDNLSPVLVKTLIQTDHTNLEEICGVLESLCMDVLDIRLSLAKSLSNPAETEGVPCLAELLDFVEHANYPPYWSEEPAEKAAREKGFDVCKAAVIKAIIEVAGEDKNAEALWAGSEPEKPGSVFVDRMVRWIRDYTSGKVKDREDLVVCATLSLGNAVRKDAYSKAVAHPPLSLAPDLAALLVPEASVQVKHGAVGLLKNLSQLKENRAILGQAGIIQKLATSGLFSDKLDMLEMVQVYSIGIAKHLCNGDADNAVALLLPDPSDPDTPTTFTQILALVRRSDTVAVKSEGTRVFVNAIRTLWSNDASSKDPAWPKRRKEAMEQLVTPATATALAQLVGRSRKYPILINEGVVALSLLSTHSAGGVAVLDGLMNPLPTESQRGTLSVPMSAGPATESPVAGTPRRTLDMLATCLRNADGRIPPELRANICALVGQLGRAGVVPESRAHDLRVLKEELRDLLEASTKEANPVGAAAKRVLDTWAMS